MAAGLCLLVCAAACGPTGHSMRAGDGVVRTRPLVVAHRGFSARAPENTLVAYRLAIEVGAEMAECDVHLSADGVPVLMHDDTLDRTTNGSGPVSALTARDLHELDAGSWKGARYAGEPVPTLREALELTRHKLRFVIEIKDASMAAQVVETIRQSGSPPDGLMVFSFAREAVAEIARLEPLLPTTWLIDELPPEGPARREVFRQALRARVLALGLSHKKLDAAFVRQAHERGFVVFSWTLNTERAMRRAIRLGVDAIITDHPDVLLRLLSR